MHFRDANFQVKEIPNPGEKRGDEIRAIYKRLRAATTLEEAIGPAFGFNIPTPSTIYSLVWDEATRLASDQRYAVTKRQLDLLFYVTRSRASPIRQEEIDTEQLTMLGWRSISCLAGTQALVLFAQTDAPAFLRAQ